MKVVGNFNRDRVGINMPNVSRLARRYTGAVAGMKSIVPTWFSIIHAWQDRARELEWGMIGNRYCSTISTPTQDLGK
jgi:hypothetical protein